jgi:hypothetical protein
VGSIATSSVVLLTSMPTWTGCCCSVLTDGPRAPRFLHTARPCRFELTLLVAPATVRARHRHGEATVLAGHLVCLAAWRSSTVAEHTSVIQRLLALDLACGTAECSGHREHRGPITNLARARVPSLPQQVCFSLETGLLLFKDVMSRHHTSPDHGVRSISPPARPRASLLLFREVMSRHHISPDHGVRSISPPGPPPSKSASL